MAEISSIKAKLDVLDFLIEFLIEHEKKMDRIISRLEKLEDEYMKRIAEINRNNNRAH